MAKMGVVMRAGMKTQMAEMKTNQEGLVAGLEKIKAKMEACLEKMEVYPVSVDWLHSRMQRYVL
jgi:hypothetical protein